MVLVRTAEAEAVLTSTYNLCFEQKYEKYQRFLSEKFQFLEVKFSTYLHRHVFVMVAFFLLDPLSDYWDPLTPYHTVFLSTCFSL